jgi:PAS domain S-box-containing protein
LYETELRRDYLETTLESIGDAVIVCDSSGKVTLMNTAAVEATGWKSEQAKGQPLESVFRIINEGTREPVESPVAKVLRVGGVVGLANHTLLVRRDGSELPIDDSGAPIRGKNKEIVGVVLVFRDIAQSSFGTQANREFSGIAQTNTRDGGTKFKYSGSPACNLRTVLSSKPHRNHVGYLASLLGDLTQAADNRQFEPSNGSRTPCDYYLIKVECRCKP